MEGTMRVTVRCRHRSLTRRITSGMMLPRRRSASSPNRSRTCGQFVGGLWAGRGDRYTQRRPQPRALFPPVAKIGCVRLRDLPPEGLKQLITSECGVPRKRRIYGLDDEQRTELRFDDKGL